MRRVPTPLLLLLSLFAGAFFAVVSRHAGPDGGAVSAPPAPGISGPARAADARVADPVGPPNRTSSPRQDFPRILAGSELPLRPLEDLGEAERSARKLAALDEILAMIDADPAWAGSRGDRLARYAGQLASEATPRVQCWSPDTPRETVQAYLAVERRLTAAAGFQALALQGSSRWSRTATNGSSQGSQGLPVTITWSIVPDGTPITASDAEESSDPSSLRARLAALYGGSASGDPAAQPWFSVFQATFDNLAANSGLRFVYEPADDGVTIDGAGGSSRYGILGQRADIRIGGHPIDGNSGVLAYAYFPDSGDVVIDTNDSYIATTSNNSIRLRNILEHEIGHSLGLPHVCPVNQTKLMEPFINLSFRGSQFDDVYSQQRRYGDPLEAHGTLRNNDSAANATTLALVTGSTSAWQWLSIDDNSDTDFFSLSATRSQLVTVRVIPSDPVLPADPDTDTYLEGAQDSDGSCSAGSAFDPTTQQDLVLDLLAADGSTVVASAPARAAGATEEISAVRPPADGNYYIRVRGGTTDRAQLYRLEVLVVDAPPAPDIAITSTRIDAESNSGANGVPDPDETIRLGITLANNGNLPATDLDVTVTAAGATFFSGSASYGSLAPGESGERMFTFALAGLPGDVVEMQLAVTAGEYTTILPLPLTLGTVLTSTPLHEDFDDSQSLPATWTQETSGAGSPWTISSSRSGSAPNSAFSASITPNGEALLLAPAILIGQGGGVLEFQHRYLLETSRDGGVLEASRNGGAWFDLMNSAATVQAGDYNGAINSGSSSAIRGRQAWTGSAAAFVTTRVALPAAWTGESIIFRWRLVHNSATVVTGWHVDDVSFSSTLPGSDPFRPVLSLTATGAVLSEAEADASLLLTLSTPLPLVQAVSVPLAVAGTAAAADVSGPLTLTLPAGQTSVSVELTAVPDGMAEGTESLLLSIPGEEPGYAPSEPSAVSVLIEDEPLLPATVALGGLDALFDGTPKAATATTEPAGLMVALTYDGNTEAPRKSGSYEVIATVVTPGYTGTAEGTLVIRSAYSAWIAAIAGPADDVATTADIDGDGWDNLGEYAFGTDPAEPSSFPRLEPVLAEGSLHLALPDPPPGVDFEAQTSTDLMTWTEEGVSASPAGVEVPRDGDRRYLRIAYTLSE